MNYQFYTHFSGNLNPQAAKADPRVIKTMSTGVKVAVGAAVATSVVVSVLTTGAGAVIAPIAGAAIVKGSHKKARDAFIRHVETEVDDRGMAEDLYRQAKRSQEAREKLVKRVKAGLKGDPEFETAKKSGIEENIRRFFYLYLEEQNDPAELWGLHKTDKVAFKARIQDIVDFFKGAFSNGDDLRRANLSQLSLLREDCISVFGKASKVHKLFAVDQTEAITQWGGEGRAMVIPMTGIELKIEECKPPPQKAAIVGHGHKRERSWVEEVGFDDQQGKVALLG